MQEIAKGILRHTKVKSVPFSTITLSVVIGILLVEFQDGQQVFDSKKVSLHFVTGTVVATPEGFRCHRN